MIPASFTAASGMLAQRFFQDSTANNLANLNTTAFKRNETGFEDLIYQSLRIPGTATVAGLQVPTGIQLGLGVRVSDNSKVFTQGPLEPAPPGSLSVAVTGEGFFQVRDPTGSLLYTRDGAFQVIGGQITDSNGFVVQPGITVPPGAVFPPTIAPNGTVTVLVPPNPNPIVIGQIPLARFINPQGLSALGNNLYAQTGASGGATIAAAGQQGNGILQQGFLEGSNVDVTRELVNLVLSQQAFTFNTRSFIVSNEMLQAAQELIR